MKRIFDVVLSSLGLLVCSPLLLVVIFLIWRHDRHSPFYIAPRVGEDGSLFTMVKLRSMTANADKSQVDSTASNDLRITPVGHFVRRYKLDEIIQLWNVLKGDMSMVGPRPNVQRETSLYTREEKRLLSVKPGITDFSSIVFSDEGDILRDQADPDIAYNQLIRPWKSRFGLFYIDHQSLVLDTRLVLITALAVVSRKKALKSVVRLLLRLEANAELISVATRADPLVPTPPPGASEVVYSR